MRLTPSVTPGIVGLTNTNLRTSHANVTWRSRDRDYERTFARSPATNPPVREKDNILREFSEATLHTRCMGAQGGITKPPPPPATPS